MKYGPTQLFPIFLLALMAGLSFLLERAVAPEPAQEDSKRLHHTDAIAENIVARRFDDAGHVKYRLIAPYLVHFSDDDSSELRDPLLVNYRPAAAPVEVRARHARVTAKGETVYMWDDVSVTRTATPERPAMVGRMPDLTAQPDAGFAFTSSPVEITEGKSWIKGVGARIDNNTSTFVLQSQVTGLYIRPKTSP